MGEAVNSFRSLYLTVDSFRTALYNQKHAFYFRKVKTWETCIRVRNRPDVLQIANIIVRRMDGLRY